MELTFTLRNGTRAGVRPKADMEDLVIARPCLERSAPGQAVALTFHVPNKQVLDRMMERFGTSGC